MEHFKKYDKIYYLGHKDNTCLKIEPGEVIHIEEKIDGGNFRFFITRDNKVIIGTRTQQITSDEGEDSNVSKDFIRCCNYVREQIKKSFDISNNIIEKNRYIFYGESCHKHTITYDFARMPPYLGFDIFDMVTGKYLDYSEKRLIV